MSDKKQRIVLDDFSGGRNGIDSPVGPDFKDNEVVDAVNVDWYHTSGLRKRYGSSNTSMTGSTMTGTVSAIFRHVPGTSDADAELWVMDDAGSASASFQRLDNSATWAPASIKEFTVGTNGWDVTWASLQGLLFISAQTSVNRLHVWDSVDGDIRRTGIPASNAPTVANTGAGAYAATLRYYRVRWQSLTAAGTVRRSEASASVSFTPSGAGTAARITQPAAPGSEDLTTAGQWFVEASSDNVTFYVISGGLTNLITTFFDDTSAPANYSAGGFALSALTGTFTLQKSYRLIAADQNRLIGWGSWTSTDKQNRMEFGAVIGSLDIGDAERIDTTTNYFLDFDELDSGPPKALIGPVWGRFYAFKTRQMYELIPTGSIVEPPYRREKISGELGCVSSHGACKGEDGNGSPCLYILTHRGVYSYGLNGFNYVGKGIEDLIQGPTSTMNMAASKVIGHMAFWAETKQLWVWFATGSSNDPDTLCVLNVATGGWARYTGSIATARCSAMFANSIGATMGFSQVPYIGSTAAVNRVVKAADSAVNQDAGTNVQATIKTRPIEIAGYNVEVGDAVLLAPPSSGVTITATMTPDFGAQPTKAGTALLTAAGSETKVTKVLQGSALSSAQFIQMTLGDASAANNTWSIDRVVIPAQKQEPITG